MNIYVSNLSFRVNDDDLKTLFEEYGEVTSAKVIMDRYSGKSRGFGFVEMKNDSEGQVAIEKLNQAKYDDNVIGVSVAKPKESNSGNRGGSYGGGGGSYGGGGGYNKKRY